VPRSILVKIVDRPDSRSVGLRETRSQRIFYSVFVPLGAVVNIVLGILILSILSWLGPPSLPNFKWMLVVSGAFCCFVGGWLAAAYWSKSYWNRSMARQVAVWRRIADTFFAWLEDAPVPAEALVGLKSSLEDVVPNSKQP